LRGGVGGWAEGLEAALVFGAGVARHRGGPMRYIEAAGRDKLNGRLRELEAKFGDRFKPGPGWDALN